MRQYDKYTKERLEAAVKQSVSIAGVLQLFGKKLTGGNYSHIKQRIKFFEIDASHFTGQSTNSGVAHKGGHKKLTHNELLVENDKHYRINVKKIKRALIESGRKYECECCQNNGSWLGKELTLQIDHKDGNWQNNKGENLRFLCPNCHTQTETHGSKIRGCIPTAEEAA